MKLAVMLAMVAALAGCPSQKSTPEAKPRTTPIAAGSPLDTDKPDRARVELDLAVARSAILQHRQIEGSNPKSLDETGVQLHFPDDIVYDAATGTVKSRTYPML